MKESYAGRADTDLNTALASTSTAHNSDKHCVVDIVLDRNRCISIDGYL